MTKLSVGLFALRVKEWWEAGPPSCLLQRVGLVLTDSLILVQSIVSVVGALSLRRGRYGGPTAFPPPIHTYQGASRALGTDGSCSTFDLESAALPDDRLLHGADVDDIHKYRNVVKRKVQTSLHSVELTKQFDTHQSHGPEETKGNENHRHEHDETALNRWSHCLRLSEGSPDEGERGWIWLGNGSSRLGAVVSGKKRRSSVK